MTASDVIQALDLEPLPKEGGYFRRTWLSPVPIQGEPTGEGDRRAASMIYYLIERWGCSRMHRVTQEEHWFYHAGDPLQMLILLSGGDAEQPILGADIMAGQRPQVTVPASAWQGASAHPGAGASGWTLVSAVVCPAFQWEDFAVASRAELMAGWPGWEAAIMALTPGM